MGIQITGNLVDAPPVYDKIFIVKAQMQQTRYTEESETPEYKWIVDYQIYGVTGNDRSFKDKIYTVKFEDSGAALTDLEGAVAAALEADNDIDSAVVT